MFAARPSRAPRVACACRVAMLCALLACGAVGARAEEEERGTGGTAPLAIETSEVPTASWNLPYSVALDASGGSGTYAWSLGAGASLPAGLALTSGGLLSGVPRTPGRFAFHARVADRARPAVTATRTVTLVVAAGIDGLVAAPGPKRGSVVLRFTSPPAVRGRTTAYEVRASVRHIASEAALLAAAVVPQRHRPRAPGTEERLTLADLEPGQTLQFAVRPVQAGLPGGFTYAVASRVATGSAPRPRRVTRLTGPTRITKPGTYLLTRHVRAEGTAFTIAAKDVVLDLGGHTVTYGLGPGRAHGVHADLIHGALTVRNGRIAQGSGGGAACHGLRLVEIDRVRVSNVDVTVRGTDADGISIAIVPGPVRVDHCTVHCGTPEVTNRHWPGVCAIRVHDASGSAEIDHNRITASPQWGINLQGEASSGDVLVHHNVVRGTKALVANGYMIGVYKRHADVFENDLVGESRGIHVASGGKDGIDCRVHDNVMWVQDQPNEEYPEDHWVHGIKVEGAPGCQVFDNVVTGVADDAHAAVHGIDVALQNEGDGDVGGVEIRRNRVTAIARTPKFRAYAFYWGEGTARAANDTIVRHNVFRATDRVLMHGWGGGRGTLVRDNVLVRDLTLGAGHEFFVQEFGNGSQPNPGNRLLDAHTSEDLLHVFDYHEARPYDATVEWTLAVRVHDAAGAPVPDATVTAAYADGASAFRTRADARGFAQGTVVQARITNGPAVARCGPVTLEVRKDGVGACRQALAVKRRTALGVDLTAGTASPDTTPPAAPHALSARSLSASRVLLRWAGADDDVGVAAWLVHLGDDVVGITDRPRFVVPGLAADSRHTFAVRALDFAGNTSAPASAQATTRPEDRGP